jgi:hypothetical protein
MNADCQHNETCLSVWEPLFNRSLEVVELPDQQRIKKSAKISENQRKSAV